MHAAMNKAFRDRLPETKMAYVCAHTRGMDPVAFLKKHLRQRASSKYYEAMDRYFHHRLLTNSEDM